MSGTTTVGSWQGVEAAALAAFSGSINAGAPALVAAIQRATRYAVVDTSAREIVLDRRAVLFGLLSVGLQDTPSRALGNTATWFAGWLGTRVPDLVSKILGPALTGTDVVLKAFGAGFAVVASVSMRGILPRAREIAGLTVNRSVADLRHFFVAMLEPHGGGWSEFSDLGWTPSDADLVAFRQELLARIGGAPERGEKMEVWHAILGGMAGSEGKADVSSAPDIPDDDMLSPLARRLWPDGNASIGKLDYAAVAFVWFARGLMRANRRMDIPSLALTLVICAPRLLAGANLRFLTALRTRLKLDRPGPAGMDMVLRTLSHDEALFDILQAGGKYDDSDIQGDDTIVWLGPAYLIADQLGRVDGIAAMRILWIPARTIS